jgi:hypothetical protein
MKNKAVQQKIGTSNYILVRTRLNLVTIFDGLTTRFNIIQTVTYKDSTMSGSIILICKTCEVRDLNPRSRAWEARTLTRLG